jgi:2,4-dienoyl-CoA reductase-like NADH-dependent reductase (Old Yellow Enzyme family)
MRKLFRGPPIAAGAFEPDAADSTVANGDADLIAFARYFISNPDLPRHIRDNLPLSPYDRSINAATTGTFFAISAASTTRLLWGISHPSRR